ncbi:MAG: hypothetical protein V3S01_04245 [Dehalococcoidia bacterium]
MEPNLLGHIRLLNPGVLRTLRAWFGAATLLAGTAAAYGQVAEPAEAASPPSTPKTHPRDPTLWNIDQMMEDAVLQISRRYNLNKAQEEYTRLLLVRRTRVFLELYEDEVRRLLKESIDFTWGQREASPESYKDWAGRALPVYEAAKEAILEGNMEWREILTEDQKVTHDQDLDQMQANFAQISNVMEAWQKGKGPHLRPRGNRRTGKEIQTAGQVTSQPAVIKEQLLEASWLSYVERFILTYQLDEKQQNAAKAGVHKELLGQARAYREKHKVEFTKIEKTLKSLEGDPKKSNQRRTLNKQKTDLEKPICRMFVMLDRRLKAQAREAQLAKPDPKHQEVLEEMYGRLAGTRTTPRRQSSRPKGGPGAKPAATSSTAELPEKAKPADAGPESTGAKDPAPQGPQAGDVGPAKGEAKPAKEPKARKPTPARAGQPTTAPTGSTPKK